MTEYNYFCWSKKFNDDKSFQQKRFRVFNVEVTEEEYKKIIKINHKLEFDKDDDCDVRFSNAFKKMWVTLSDKEQQEYLNIPHFNWEGFTYITGVTPDMVKSNSLVGAEVEVKVNGKVYKAKIVE